MGLFSGLGRKPRRESAPGRWDAANLVTLSTHLTAARCAEFDAVCKAAGVSRYEALRRFCVACIMRPETLTGLRWQRAPRRRK